jgi:phosphatidylinositol alpha-1,6-mannosyltransferase
VSEHQIAEALEQSRDGLRQQPAGSPGPSQAMNILMLTDLFLPHSGGSRVYYYNLYKHLATDFPDEVTILTTKIPGGEEFDRRVCTESLRIVRRFRPLDGWKYHQLPKGILSLMPAVRLIHERRVDVLHCGDLYPPGAIGLLLKRWTGMPYLMFSHGDEISQTENRRYQPRVRDRIYCGADFVVAANQFAYRHLLRIGVRPERLRKITPGVDRDRFRPLPRNRELAGRLGLERSTVLLSVGRLAPKKGFPLVLQAVAKAARQCERLRYLIAGDGPERPQLERMVHDLGITEAVTFLGDVPQEKLAELYNLCDVFVLANREAEGDVETFGMVFLEASAVGKPVVGGRSGGTAEAVLDGVTGFLVDPKDPEELAGALCSLIRDPELRQRMGSAGLRRAHSEFDWSRRAGELREITREVILAARRGR